MLVHSRLNCYWNLKVMVFKEKGEPVPGKKPLEAYRIQRTVNKFIHCTFIGISPPQNLRLLEDKKFVSHSPSEKEKKNFCLY